MIPVVQKMVYCVDRGLWNKMNQKYWCHNAIDIKKKGNYRCFRKKGQKREKSTFRATLRELKIYRIICIRDTEFSSA